MTDGPGENVEWVDSVWFIESWGSCLTAFLYRTREGQWQAVVALRSYSPLGHDHDDIEAFTMTSPPNVADPRSQMFRELDAMARDSVADGVAKACHHLKVDGGPARLTELMLQQPWCHLAEEMAAAARKRGNVATA